MALVVPWPSVRQALIRQLRSNLVLTDQLLGDWSEGFAPPGTAFPRGILSLHYAPALYDWTGVVNILGVDVLIFAKDQGDAASIFQLVFTTLQDQRLTVTGQTSLSCRFTSSLSLQDEDAQGKPIYEVGGVLEIRVTQSNPALRSLVFTADSDIA
jgi:hypothetical protein